MNYSSSSSSSSSSADADAHSWNSLHNAAVDIISQKLLPNCLDYICFRSVCHYWRFIAPPVKFAPLLLCPPNFVTGTVKFFSPSDNRTFTRIVEEARDKIFCGSTQGLLVLLDNQRGSLSLVNPITNDSFELPSVTNEILSVPWKIEVSHQDMINGVLPDEDMYERAFYCIEEITISSYPNSIGEDCYVVAIITNSTTVAFCRFGEKQWTLIDTLLTYPVQSAIYIASTGMFYFADVGSGAIAIFNPRNPTSDNQITLTKFNIPFLNHSFSSYRYRLAASESSSDLLLIVPILDDGLPGDPHKYYHYEIYKLEMNRSEEDIPWSQIEDIGENVVFISRCYNSHFIGNRPKGCKQNSIYFAKPSPIPQAHKDINAQIEVLDIQQGRTPKGIMMRFSRQPHWSLAMKYTCWFQPHLM